MRRTPDLPPFLQKYADLPAGDLEYEVEIATHVGDLMIRSLRETYNGFNGRLLLYSVQHYLHGIDAILRHLNLVSDTIKEQVEEATIRIRFLRY